MKNCINKKDIKANELLDYINVIKFIKLHIPNQERFISFKKEFKNKLIQQKIMSIILKVYVKLEKNNNINKLVDSDLTGIEPNEINIKLKNCKSEDSEILNYNDNKKLFKILCVEDIEIIRKSICKILREILEKKKLNYEVIEASDGEDTVKLILEDQKDNLIKFCISDECMISMNGSQSIKLIREYENEGKVKKK